MKNLRHAAVALCALFSTVPLSSCEDGTMEEVGEEVDEAGEDVEEAIDDMDDDG
jgi:predicted small secreted protein